MAIKLNTPKGTRDFSPAEMVRRNYIFDTIKSVFKKYGYQPIETPAMENSETLMGKYGDEGDRLIFKILDSGEYLQKINSEAFDEIESPLLSDAQAYQEFLGILLNQVPESLINLFSSNASLDYFKNWRFGTYWFNWKDRLVNHYDQFFVKTFEEAFLRRLVLRPKAWELPNGDYTEEIPAIEYFYTLYHTAPENLNSAAIKEFKEFVRYDAESLKIQSLFGVIKTNQFTNQISEKALRYDLTVPFARYVVQHRNEITFPFKRYQVQPVWRADRPQKGRYREFYQCDIDLIGSDSLLNEVEMVQVVDEVFSKLNVPVTVKINNRKLLAAIAEVIGAPDAFVDITVALDKLDKIGEEKVCQELIMRDISNESIDKLLPLMRFQGDTSEKLDFLKTYLAKSEIGQKGISEVSEVLETAQRLISSKTVLELDLTLARGLNYYTGAIFEVRSNIEGTLSSSISGGGRYDDLTGIFGMPNVSGVGISFGADRIYDVLQEANLFPEFTSDSTQVFFVNFGAEEANYCLGLVKQLREAGINTELYPDKAKMQKQMTYANNNSIPFVAMVGTQEMESGKIGVKNMVTGEQSSLTISELISIIP